MRYVSILMTFLILGCAEIPMYEPASIAVKIKNGFEGSETWIGLTNHDEKNSATTWASSTESEFLIEVPDTQSAVTIVLLTKNAVPIVQSVTPALITDGMTVEFSKGVTVTGKVASKSDGTPITDGLVFLRFDEELGVQLPAGVSIFSWDLQEDGTFVVHGVPLGEHSVEVRAAGYMLAEELVAVTILNQQPQLDIFMEQGFYIVGRIVEYKRTIRHSLVFRGEIDAELVSSENQTEEFRIEFDEEDNFTVGPFANDTVVNLQAWLPDGRRSKLKEVIAPAEDVELDVHHWVRVTGKVQDSVTGEPVEEYVVTALVNHAHRSEIKDANGMFSVEMGEYAYDLTIEAPDYQFWTTVELSQVFEEGAECDVGTIELDRAHTVRGRVVSRATGEPIAGATVYRSDGGAPDWDSHTQWMFTLHLNYVRTKTDSNGEFELKGFPLKNGKITASASGFLSSASKTVDDPNTFLELKLDPKGSISGQVVSLEGEPVAAKIVSRSGTLARTEDGNFYMETYVGKQSFWAISDSGRSQVMEVKTDVGEVIEGVRIVIDNMGRVRGNVTGLWKGESVTVYAGGTYQGMKSNGPYEIVGLLTGSHDVIGRTSFGRDLTGSINISKTLEARFDLDFPEVTSLSGRVVAGTEGFGEYQIVARPENERSPLRRIKTKRDGSYEFAALVPGAYDVEIPSRAFAKRVIVSGDTKLDFDVGASELNGTVHTKSSLRDVYVLLKGNIRDREIKTWTQIDEAGSYRFTGLPEGTYTVQLTNPNFEGRSQRVKINRRIVSFDIDMH